MYRRTALVLAVLLVGTTLRAAEPVTEIEVTGRPLVVNGQDEIATGLFGVHAYKLTEENIETYGIECFRQIHFSPSSAVAARDRQGEIKPVYKKLSMVIDCPGDRYMIPTVLTNRDFEEFFTKIGTQYGKKATPTSVAEFWNEPYLNWASRSHGSGRNVYHPKWYETENRTDGGKVTIKGWDKPLEHLRWRKHWARGEDGKIYYGVKIPEGLKPGDTFKGRSPEGWYFTNRKKQIFTVVEQWGIWDPTQVSFWSGRQNRDFYIWMFLPYARAIKKANRDVPVIGGWDFGLSHGDWAVWEELYKPVIDAGHEYMDGITDHHYGVNTRWVPLWYEVACDYSMGKYGKWLKGYNTECGGKLDPAVHGEAKNVLGTPSGTYALRDIMELLYHAPAKSGSRTAHHPDKGVLGTLQFLKDLRGKLIACDTSNPNVWPVASIHDNKLVCVIFNNEKTAQQIKLDLDRPANYRLDKATRTYSSGDKSGDVDVSKKSTFKLPPLSASKIVVKLQPMKDAYQPVRKIVRKQFFSKGGPLRDVQAGKMLRMTIMVEPKFLAAGNGAKLKLCLQNVDAGELSVKLNNKTIDVPDTNFTIQVPIDPALVETENELTFTGKGNGYRVVSASLVIDR